MIKAYAKSDIGKVREINQDSYYISDSLDEVQLYMLADGMGGCQGGEIASKLAIQSAKNYIENNFKEIEKDRDSIIQLVGSSMEYANMIVYEKSKENKELEGMGTTLEICLIYNNKVFIGHVGDSRIYRIRKEFMRKLTQDHSYVQKLVKDGTITAEEAVHHPQKIRLNPSHALETEIATKTLVSDRMLANFRTVGLVNHYGFAISLCHDVTTTKGPIGQLFQVRCPFQQHVCS